jgi:hypothetical protein
MANTSLISADPHGKQEWAADGTTSSATGTCVLAASFSAMVARVSGLGDDEIHDQITAAKIDLMEDFYGRLEKLAQWFEVDCEELETAATLVDVAIETFFERAEAALEKAAYAQSQGAEEIAAT